MAHKISNHSILFHIYEFEKNGDSLGIVADDYIKQIEKKVMQKLGSGFFKFDESIFDHNSFVVPKAALLAEMSKVDIKYNVSRIEVDILLFVFLILFLQKNNQF